MHLILQSVCIVHNQFFEILEPFGCSPVPVIPGLWIQKAKTIIFAQVVDYYGLN